MCVSSQLKQSCMEVRTAELSRSDTVFSLLPSCFVYHTLLCQVIPHAVWVWFEFLRVSQCLGQDNTAKNTHLTVTGWRLFSICITFLLPAAHSLMEENERE